MSPHAHFEPDVWRFSVLTATLLLAAGLYLRGWIQLRPGSRSGITAWRASSFFLSLLLIWTALGSPFASYDHDLLTVHMIRHLLLMTFAPALLLLGDSIRAFWLAMPRFAQRTFGAVFRRPRVHGFGRVVTKPAACWVVSAFTLIAWHIPALFSMGVRSNLWHTVEQATFFGAGLLFWWPVVQPWPSARTSPSWPVLLYLFLATLPCDILSGFLVFSDRVAYPVYFSAPRLFGFSALEDQQCAAALMWTCVTIVYLVPAAIISIKLLAPATSQESESAHSDISGRVLPASDATSLEVV